MDEARINATITVLINQRNDALNAAVQAIAEAEVLRGRMAKLEAEIAAMKEAPRASD